MVYFAKNCEMKKLIFITTKDLTDLYKQHTAYEIEDVLCIYKIMLTQSGIDGPIPNSRWLLKRVWTSPDGTEKEK